MSFLIVSVLRSDVNGSIKKYYHSNVLGAKSKLLTSPATKVCFTFHMSSLLDSMQLSMDISIELKKAMTR